AQTQNSFAIRMDAPDSLPPLPTAVETAAYYIALEALTNVEKHSGARSCHIRVALVMDNPPTLELDITDDGRGLPLDATHGLGLLSMQARAAEVGGTCIIESMPHSGARVSVRLPCPAWIDEAR
ncbi:MAG TPA: ATP-binding protein, partial [Anaerolineales bacterium]|nr:ATP-binding protein [Anaerolineales bacterium]